MDNLLLDHVGLPHVLVLAVHLVNLLGWMGKVDHFKTHVIIVSAQSKDLGFWVF